MKAAQITIGVTIDQDGNPQLGIQFVGSESHLLTLLGGITHAQQWVSDRIGKQTGGGAWGHVDGVQSVPIREEEQSIASMKRDQYPMEQKVTRDKAIEATQYAIDSMNLRIEAMKNSPEASTFSINPSLLSQL